MAHRVDQPACQSIQCAASQTDGLKITKTTFAWYQFPVAAWEEWKPHIFVLRSRIQDLRYCAGEVTCLLEKTKQRRNPYFLDTAIIL